MKKRLNSILLVMFLLFITGCNKNNEIKDSSIMYHDIKQVDKYLYEISYDDYKYDENLLSITGIENFGCSSVKNGNYYGRNFDFIFNDVPEFVVKVKSNEKRHASIGVAILSGIHASDNISNHKNELEILPNATMDGINDAGVISSINVVPKDDVVPVTGTNPDGEKLHMSFIVRYVLDNASSADNAIELLKQKNIYGDVGEHYNLHVMISDINKTYVVEFIDNKMVVDEKTNDEQIMTNYYVNLEEYTEYSAGIERYNILKENYSEGNTFEGMWNLLQRVKYSKVYLFDKEEWYSEFLPQSVINGSAAYIDSIKDEIITSKQNYWIARAYDERNPSNIDYWFTTHNSTYDISQRKLRVTIQENYNKYYEYILEQ